MDQTGGGYAGAPTSEGVANGDPLHYLQYGTQLAMPTQQPNSFDMVAANPSSQQQYAQQPDPLMPAEVRPDWQQQIYAELAGNVPVGTSQPIAGGQISNPAPQYQPQVAQVSYPTNPVPVYQPTAPVQPTPEHFQISYDQTTGEPVPAPQTSTAKKVIIITTGIVLVLSLLGGVGFAAYTMGKNAGYAGGVEDTKKSFASQSKDTDNTQNTNDKDAENDNELLNFEMAQPVYKEEAVSGIVGEQLQLSDGMVLYVKDVERNFQPSDASYSSMPGEELIKVNLLVGNADATQSKVISNDMFGLRDLSGSLVLPRTNIGNYEGQIDKLEVSSGGKIRMSLVFSVESGATPLTLVRQQAYNLRSLGQTVNMKIEVIFE